VKIIIDISDAKVSKDAKDTLMTYSLGSCIGVALYDPATRSGGMLHYQLPSAKMDPAKAAAKPFMFADSGMEKLMKKILAFGAAKKHLQIKIAGGAQMMNDAKTFNIGKRNYTALRQLLWKNGMFIDSEDIGGKLARNLSLDIADGTVKVTSQGQTKVL